MALHAAGVEDADRQGLLNAALLGLDQPPCPKEVSVLVRGQQGPQHGALVLVEAGQPAGATGVLQASAKLKLVVVACMWAWCMCVRWMCDAAN